MQKFYDTKRISIFIYKIYSMRKLSILSWIQSKGDSNLTRQVPISSWTFTSFTGVLDLISVIKNPNSEIYEDTKGRTFLVAFKHIVEYTFLTRNQNSSKFFSNIIE